LRLRQRLQEVRAFPAELVELDLEFEGVTALVVGAQPGEELALDHRHPMMFLSELRLQVGQSERYSSFRMTSRQKQPRGRDGFRTGIR